MAFSHEKLRLSWRSTENFSLPNYGPGFEHPSGLT